jgi:hypothetical protein
LLIAKEGARDRLDEGVQCADPKVCEAKQRERERERERLEEEEGPLEEERSSDDCNSSDDETLSRADRSVSVGRRTRA